MLAVRKHVVTLYVDRSTQQWILQDADANFWILPSFDDAWNHRQPFEPADDSQLEPVPGHYKYLFQLPF